MRYPMPGLPRRVAPVVVLGVLLCGPVLADTPASDSGTVSAVWTPKQLRFSYMGFTTKFSCDGLADQVREVLLLFGARKKDLKVSPTGCTRLFGGPEPFPGVTIKMDVLEPASGKSNKNGKANAETVPAHWQMVDVDKALDRDPLRVAGQCELVEQIKETILPQFTTRNIEYNSTCVPHQLSIGGTRLRTEVLMPDAQDRNAPPPTAK